MKPAPFFDQLCKVAEQYFPKMHETLRKAKLFVFDDDAPKFLPKNYTAEEVQFMTENFFLPFKVTAVEDKTSVVVLADTLDDTKGISEPRMFIELINPQLSTGLRDDTAILEHRAQGVLATVSIGVAEVIPVLEPDKTNTQFHVKGCINRFVFVMNNGLRDVDVCTKDPEIQRQLSCVLLSPSTAVQELWYANTPNQFVVEVTPGKVRDPETAPKIPRSHERPQYILLKPDEIRKRFIPQGPANPSGVKKAPHERRRHWRTLRSDKFVHKQGSTILIPATWVGSTEAKIGNRTYRVRLDL